LEFARWVSDVSYSLGLKWIFIALIPITLGWKVAADFKPARPSREIVEEFLTRQRFDVVVTDRMILSDLPLIRATAGTCRMLVAEASPDGWNDAIIRDVAGAMNQLFLVYHGRIYKPQSRWLTVTEYWLSRYLRRLGLAPQRLPLIAVAATESCNAEQLPWSELGMSSHPQSDRASG